MRVAINAAGLHSGGALQVATSFLLELSQFDLSDKNITVFVSSEIHAALQQAGLRESAFTSYQVFDVFGIRTAFSGLTKRLSGFDVVFTVFGPAYCFVRSKRHVVGFAQAWIAYPENEVYALLSKWQRLAFKVKFSVQKFFFRNADQFVVELAHVKKKLILRGIAAPEAISVVHNSVSTMYTSDPANILDAVPQSRRVGRIAIGYLGRGHPHKNLAVLPPVKRHLKSSYGIEAEFLVTLTVDEWKAQTKQFRDAVINVGPLALSECPEFYLSIDGVIFPSLLECFSVTPLETMAMLKPLFASDRHFLRDVCGDHAIYIDPMSPSNISKKIAEYYSASKDRSSELALARQHAMSFSNARQRAQQYLDILYSEPSD